MASHQLDSISSLASGPSTTTPPPYESATNPAPTPANPTTTQDSATSSTLDPATPQTHTDTMPLTFGRFSIPTSQVFHLTPLTFCLVNLRPLLPGHVLICPRRSTARIPLLTPAELTDLFATTQKVQRMLTKAYRADGFNIAVQDGAAAGQSVPHVHVHVIPRRWGDGGQEDKIYELLQSEDGDLGSVFEEERRGRGVGAGVGEGQAEGREEVRRQMFPVPRGERRNRTLEEMGKEAGWLRGLMEEMEAEGEQAVEEAVEEKAQEKL